MHIYTYIYIYIYIYTYIYMCPRAWPTSSAPPPAAPWRTRSDIGATLSEARATLDREQAKRRRTRTEEDTTRPRDVSPPPDLQRSGSVYELLWPEFFGLCHGGGRRGAAISCRHHLRRHVEVRHKQRHATGCNGNGGSSKQQQRNDVQIAHDPKRQQTTTRKVLVRRALAGFSFFSFSLASSAMRSSISF